MERKRPYMGMVAVRHRSGSTYLHGSDVQHMQTIALTISDGIEIRSLHENRYHDEGRHIEIEMTPLQWLELITNPNTGCGTPCTLRWIRGEGLIESPEAPEIEIDKSHREFQAKLGKIPETLDDLERALNETNLSQKTKKELSNKVDSVRTELRSNLPFAFEQFKEATEHLLAEAKATAETYISQALFRLGLRTAKSLEAPEKLRLEE